MKILVTGGCGYIGSNVVHNLHLAGHSVTVVDNLSTGTREALRHGETLEVADIRDEGALDRIFERGAFDAVAHFAASIAVGESVREPLAYYANNTGGTLALLRACQRHSVARFLFSSTAAVYGTKSGTPIDENSSLAPESPYGSSKMMSEAILRDFAATGAISFVILRYFNVAGADVETGLGQRVRNATHLIKVACEVAAGKRSEMVVHGNDYATTDGTGVRDYIHVLDLANAHVLALDHLAAGRENLILNCGYGKGATVLQVIDAVRRASGGSLKYRVGPRREGDVASVIADASQLRSKLPWRPQHDHLDDIVRSAWIWEKGLA